MSEKKVLTSLEEVFDLLNIGDGATLSFHHHLRNGDYVLNKVAAIIKERNIKHIHLCPSSLFPNNAPLVELIENGNITDIDTNYLNGPVAKAISEGKLQGKLRMHTHGGRPRAIKEGDIKIDVAFVACPTVDKEGRGTGAYGKSACGVLGYAMEDVAYAKHVILVTDNLVDKIETDKPEIIQIDGSTVEYIVHIDSIGDANGIVSGTTKITKDPVGLKIARMTANLLDELGVIKDGVSMQTGAGGTSLAVASYVKQKMIEKGVKGSFASGGITGYFVNMLEEGLLDHLMDVQCFDLDAVASFGKNKNHIPMSASKYANPNDDPVVNKLDFVILGATEIDLDYNVNVITSSHNEIMGGSGGHSDTAHGAYITIITTNLIKARLPIIKDRVNTITTPGSDIDVLVTERGIAINPKRTDLLEKLKGTRLPLKTIQELQELSYKITGVPATLKHSDEIIGDVVYRDGTVIDHIYKNN